MRAHLWQGGDDNPPPVEYIEYLVCEKFDKLPSELRREPARTVLRIIDIMGVEAEVQKARQLEGG